jgi:hypothetical protein
MHTTYAVKHYVTGSTDGIHHRYRIEPLFYTYGIHRINSMTDNESRERCANRLSVN